MFGYPLASYQLIQYKFAQILTDISLGFQGCLRVGRLKDEGRVHPTQISIIKRNSCLKSLDAARQCRDILGANGIVDEYHIMRHMGLFLLCFITQNKKKNIFICATWSPSTPTRGRRMYTRLSLDEILPEYRRSATMHLMSSDYQKKTKYLSGFVIIIKKSHCFCTKKNQTPPKKIITFLSSSSKKNGLVL